jgi:hypothetical protein
MYRRKSFRRIMILYDPKTRPLQQCLTQTNHQHKNHSRCYHQTKNQQNFNETKFIFNTWKLVGTNNEYV